MRTMVERFIKQRPKSVHDAMRVFVQSPLKLLFEVFSREALSFSAHFVFAQSLTAQGLKTLARVGTG